jgi:ABC-type bacteriocin/lantibiotic exporter with double-glycine peptidase domain
MNVSIHQSALDDQTQEPDFDSVTTWLSASQYVSYLVARYAELPPLKGSILLVRIKNLIDIANLSSSQLLSTLSSELSVETLGHGNYRRSELALVSPITFAQCGDSFLPLEAFPVTVSSRDIPDGARLLMLTDKLPNHRLTKLQYVHTFLKPRYQKLGLFLLLGSVPVLLVAISELLNQPLFDSIVPSGHVPAVFLVGIATLFFQGSGQIITSIGQQSQSVYTNQIDLVSKLATAKRFLSARSQNLPLRDAGSWRLTFFAASSFLGSLESLFVSIPLALISLAVNLVVIGAYSDFSSIVNLLLLCLIPSFVSLAISYASSTISITMMGQQSRLESIFYAVVRNIRGIWMSNHEQYFIDRFLTARQDMANSLLKAGVFAATTDIVDKVTTGLLYSFIYLEYYRATTTPGTGHPSVGSLLVIYAAIGTVSGALNSITADLVTVFQTLPTYWTPNAIRDIDSFVESRPSYSNSTVQSIRVDGLTYSAPSIRGPFAKPISFQIDSPSSVAITGPSGSGKSTLLKLLLGYLKPGTGSIDLIDRYGRSIDSDLHQTNILVLSQELAFFGDQLRDVVDPSGVVEDVILEKAASQLGLTSILDQLPLRWHTPISEYSRDLSLGQIQLFKLTKALIHPYDIIISDEPTCHLPESRHLEAIKLLNKSCQLHLSVLHRQSAKDLFSHWLDLSDTAHVSLIERSKQ